jgi:hypothetical protein
MSASKQSMRSSSSPVQKKTRTFIWRDVDDVVLFERDINWAIPNRLAALQALDAEEWSFTNMDVGDSEKSISLPKDNSKCRMSRRELEAELLAQRGVTPRGIITPADPDYNKGLGAAY